MEGSKGGLGMWEGILNEVHTETKLADKTVICLGRPGIGKRSLIHALALHACPGLASEHSFDNHCKATGLDFASFGVRDPKDSEAASSHDFSFAAAAFVVVLEEPTLEEVLRSGLSDVRLRDTVALICLDVKRPTKLLCELRMWLAVLQRLTTEMIEELGAVEQEELRARVVEALDTYRPPAVVELLPPAVTPPPPPPPAPAASPAEEPLGGSGVLTINLGIPVVVVLTRSDCLSALSDLEGTKASDLRWCAAIEAQLRSEVLPYGASLLYTSVLQRGSVNVDVLFSYLMNRLVQYPLRVAPVVGPIAGTNGSKQPKDCVFVPSGWDSPMKIDAKLLETPLEQLIDAPDPLAEDEAPKVEECEDVQTFLKRIAAVLTDQSGREVLASRAQTRPGRGADFSAVAGTRSSFLEAAKFAAVQAGEVTTPGAGAGAAPDKTVLNSFFQSLMARQQRAGQELSSTP